MLDLHIRLTVRPGPKRHARLSAEGRRVAVLGKHGPVSFGELGIVGVSFRDPGLMLGYWGAEEETSHRFQGEWFLTRGDDSERSEQQAPAASAAQEL
jgi:acyl-CoA synthetase (AMP-forming)/AMP-acid ligase II